MLRSRKIAGREAPPTPPTPPMPSPPESNQSTHSDTNGQSRLTDSGSLESSAKCAKDPYLGIWMTGFLLAYYWWVLHRCPPNLEPATAKNPVMHQSGWVALLLLRAVEPMECQTLHNPAASPLRLLLFRFSSYSIHHQHHHHHHPHCRFVYIDCNSHSLSVAVISSNIIIIIPPFHSCYSALHQKP